MLGSIIHAMIADSDGEPLAASGLRMRPLDFAKIDQLILDCGIWGGAQLLPCEWLDLSFAPVVQASHRPD